MKPFATDPERQVEIAKLISALQALSAGAVMTYPEIASLLGHEACDASTYAVQRARQQLEATDDTLRYSPVRGLGIKRLAAQDLPGIGESAIRGVRLKASRSKARIWPTRLNLKGDERLLVECQAATLSAVETATSRLERKKVLENVRQTQVWEIKS